jgi:hypothetical protein
MVKWVSETVTIANCVLFVSETVTIADCVLLVREICHISTWCFERTWWITWCNKQFDHITNVHSALI